MKAIIPVAGAGTRLRPHTYTQPKALIPVAGKPIISYMIDELLNAGVNDFIFIVGYLGDKIKDYIQSSYPNINSQYIEQQRRDGLGHAIWLTKKYCSEKEELLILLGDSVFDLDLKEIINLKHSILGIKKVEDPRYFGVAILDEQEYIIKVVEKPSIPVSNLALIGLYKIKESHELFEALEYNINHDIRTRNAIQLTDALMRMIDKGVNFKAYKVNHWFDCGQKETLLDTNTMLLKKRKDPLQDYSMHSHSIIIPPVFIHPDSKIVNSIIGPFVTVSEKSIIENSIIKDSIIGSYSNIKDVMMHRSVIGNDAIILGRSKSLNIGDDTEIDLTS